MPESLIRHSGCPERTHAQLDRVWMVAALTLGLASKSKSPNHFSRGKPGALTVGSRNARIEVVGGDSPVGLGVAEMRGTPTLGVHGGAAEDPFETPGPPRSPPPRPGHSRASRSRCGRTTSNLRSPLAKRTHGTSLASAKPVTARRNCCPVFSSNAGENREPAAGQEVHHLPTDLQIRHVPVEVDPIQALQIQRDMTPDNVVHRHRPRRHHLRAQHPARVHTHLTRSAAHATVAPQDSVGPLPDHRSAAAHRPTRPTTSAVRGWPH